MIADRLADRAALVTGGGKGIGRGIARRLAEEGAAVAVAGRELAAVEEVAAEITDRGGRALARSVDVGDEAAVEALVAETAATFGGLDVLVNNAALTAMSAIGFAPLIEMTTAEWERVLRINLSGVFFASRAAGRVMRDAGRGAIVNISSVHAHVPHALTPHYDATKAGVEALTRNLALALGPFGIRVNGVAPGPIAVGGGSDAYTPEERAAQERATVLGRFGRPEEIGAVVAFLVSDDAGYLTGQTLIVDGGFLIKHAGMASGDPLGGTGEPAAGE